MRQKFDVDKAIHLARPRTHFALHVLLQDTEQKEHDKRHEHYGDPVGEVPTENVFVCHLHTPFTVKDTCGVSFAFPFSHLSCRE